jgi:Protein of unknown function (DUF3499)
MTLCSKPSCPRPAAVTLSYDYGARTAVLRDAPQAESPHLYRLCSTCADKLRPPMGWDLLDDRFVSFSERVSLKGAPLSERGNLPADKPPNGSPGPPPSTRRACGPPERPQVWPRSPR